MYKPQTDRTSFNIWTSCSQTPYSFRPSTASKSDGDLLDLALVPSSRRESASQSFKRGDAAGLLSSLANCDALPFVLHNFQVLIDHGIYEPAIVEAITACRTNYHAWDESLIAWMLQQGDRNRYRSIGIRLPTDSSFTIYRGVAGYGRTRRLRGFNWTDSLEEACWFAVRLNLPHPAIYKAISHRDHIYCCQSVKESRHFLVQPECFRRLMLTQCEIESHASRVIK